MYVEVTHLLWWWYDDDCNVNYNIDVDCWGWWSYWWWLYNDDNDANVDISMMPRITQTTYAHDNSYCDDDASDNCKEDNDDNKNAYKCCYDDDNTTNLGSSAPGTVCKEDDIPGVLLHSNRLPTLDSPPLVPCARRTISLVCLSTLTGCLPWILRPWYRVQGGRYPWCASPL